MATPSAPAQLSPAACLSVSTSEVCQSWCALSGLHLPRHLYTSPPPPLPLLLLLLVVFNIDEFVGIYCSPSVRPSVRQAKPSSNLLRRTGGDHRGGRAQPGWRTFMMTCLRWILGYMRLEIWCKIGLSADWCLCTALRTRSGACYCCISPSVCSLFVNPMWWTLVERYCRPTAQRGG